MARLKVTTFENLIDQLDNIFQTGSAHDQVCAAVVNGPEDKVSLIMTTDNVTDLANAAVGFLQLAVEAAGNCHCENCVSAIERCRRALAIWDGIRGNVLQFPLHK